MELPRRAAKAAGRRLLFAYGRYRRVQLPEGRADPIEPRVREEDGATRVDRLDEKDRKKLRGAQLGSVAVDRHLFGAPSRFSPNSRRWRGRRAGSGRSWRPGRRRRRTGRRCSTRSTSWRCSWPTRRSGGQGGPVFKEITKVQVAGLKELARLSKEMREGRNSPGWGD